MTPLPQLLGLVVAVLASGPVPPGVQGVLALEASGQDEAALALAEELSQRTPPSALPHLEAVRLGLKLGREPTSLEPHLVAARALAPDNPRVSYLAGLLKEGEGDDAAARSLYLQAIALRSSYAEARARLLALAMRRHDWALAEAQLRALLVLGEHSVGKRLQLARVLEEGGKLSQAETVLLALHYEAPTNAAITAELADFYERHNRMQEALALRHATPAKKLRPLQPSRR